MTRTDGMRLARERALRARATLRDLDRRQGELAERGGAGLSSEFARQTASLRARLESDVRAARELRDGEARP